MYTPPGNRRHRRLSCQDFQPRSLTKAVNTIHRIQRSGRSFLPTKGFQPGDKFRYPFLNGWFSSPNTSVPIAKALKLARLSSPIESGEAVIFQVSPLSAIYNRNGELCILARQK